MMSDRIISALQFIGSDDRDTWVATGMSLKSELGESGFDIWDQWSQSSDSYKPADAKSVWKSFRGVGVTMGSLFHEAKQNGWIDNEKYARPTASQVRARQAESAARASQQGREQAKAQQEAARKAAWIMEQTVPEKHAYLQSKGFQDLDGLVWRPEQETNLLCVPMFIGRDLVGVQMIDKFGVKKFLSNQITAKAEYCFDSGGGDDFWCEGFATGLSLRACLGALKRRCRIHVTFNAGNLKRMAHSGYVIADNDESLTGSAAAQATELPYWMPPTVGDDLNDFHKANGTFKTSQILGRWLRELKENQDFYKDET